MLTRLLNLARMTRSISHGPLPQPTLEPPVRRGMSELDRAAFDTRLTLLAARLPASKANKFMKEDAKECVQYPGIFLDPSELTRCRRCRASQLHRSLAGYRRCQSRHLEGVPPRALADGRPVCVDMLTRGKRSS